MNIYHS